VDIKRSVADRLAQGGEHRNLQVADRVDAVGAEADQQFEGRRVAMSHVSGTFENDFLGQIAILAHFIDRPQHTFVVNQEAANA